MPSFAINGMLEVGVKSAKRLEISGEKYAPTRIKSVYRKVTGEDRGRYYLIRSRMPKPLMRYPGQEGFEDELKRQSVKIKLHTEKAVGDDWSAWASKSVQRIRDRCSGNARECSITRDDAIEMIVKQGYKCALTGVRFTYATTSKAMRAPSAPSIDRIAHDGGYTADNCRIVTVMANIGRSDFSDEEFFEMCVQAVLFNRLLTISRA